MIKLPRRFKKAKKGESERIRKKSENLMHL